MKLYIIKTLLAIMPFLFLSDNVWKVKSSSVTFRIKNAGIAVDGSFTGLESDIKFNPLKPAEASITASVKTATINTGTAMRDNHLRKEEYLDAEKYPKIILKSEKIEKTGPISYKGIFKLSLKNITKEVTIPFTFSKLPDRTEFKGSFKLNRRDYNVGGSSITMSDDADVSILINVTE